MSWDRRTYYTDVIGHACTLQMSWKSHVLYTVVTGQGLSYTVVMGQACPVHCYPGSEAYTVLYCSHGTVTNVPCSLVSWDTRVSYTQVVRPSIVG